MRHLLVMLFLALGLGSATAATAAPVGSAAMAGPAGNPGSAATAARLVCQRDSPPLQEALEAADVVVSGTVAKREPDPRRPEDFLLYTIRVDRVFSGTAPRTIEVRTPNSTDACGLTQLERNRDYLIAAHEARGRLTALSTDGTGRFAGPRRLMTLQMFGDGKPPTAPTPQPSDDESSTTEVTRTPVDDGGAPSFTSVAWPGLALLGGGGLIFLLALALGRRPQH